MLPFLFTTLKRRLGTEDTKWWSVSGVILSHSSCKQVLRWATVRGLRCRILRFKMRHTFSIGDRSGLQAGQSSTRTLFLRSQDFVMCAECGFALSCWNMHGRPWKRCLLESSILCSKISMYFSALMVPSQKCWHHCWHRTFSWTVPSWWNDLPISIRTAESLAIFKKTSKDTSFSPAPD